jgi:hypothetical protein
MYVYIGEWFVSSSTASFYKLILILLTILVEPWAPTTTRYLGTYTPGSHTLSATDPPTTTSPPPVTITIAITSSGTATAGESYSLECTVIVTGSTDLPMITWLMGPMDNRITSGVVTTGSMSTLKFNPLAASHAGTYTCRVTLGSAMESASRAITVRSEYSIYNLT